MDGGWKDGWVDGQLEARMKTGGFMNKRQREWEESRMEAWMEGM